MLFVVALAGVTMLLWPRGAGALDQRLVRGFDGAGSSQVVGVATDGAGNVYATGFFSGTVDFDRSASSPGDTLTASSSFDAFVLKLSSSGSFAWVRGISGGPISPKPAVEEGTGIVADGGGNVYVSGMFTSGTAQLYDSNGDVAPLAGPIGNQDVALILKLDADGGLVWSHALIQGLGRDRGGALGIALGSSGNVHVVGTYTGPSLYYDSTEILSTDGRLVSIAPSDGYVVTLASDGSFLWARRLGDGQTHVSSDNTLEQTTGVAVDTSGNVYITGSFRTTVDFDRTAVSPGDTLTAQGPTDGYVLKLDANGNFQWVRGLGGSSRDQGFGIAVTGSDVYVTGLFEGTADFDRTAVSPDDTSVSQGNLDAFVLKLDTNGSFAWVRSVGGAGFDEGTGVAVNGAGSVYVTGIYEGTVDFNPGVGTFSLSNNGGLDGFLLELDADGNFVRAEGLGGGNDDQGFASALDPNGNILVGGVFQGTVDFFRGVTVSGDTLSSAGASAGFLVRLTASSDLAVSVSDTPDPVLRGRDLTYAITAHNLGPNQAADAVLTVPLPTGTTFVSLTEPGRGWVCSKPAVGTHGTVSCTTTTFPLGSDVFTLVLHVTPTASAPGTLTSLVTLSSTSSDDAPSNNSVSVNTAVMAAPTITTTGAPLTYVENQPAIAIDPGLTIVDPDSAQLSNGSVQLTGGYQAGQDVLACPDCAGLGITATFTVATGRLDLSGTGTVASYQAALRSVTYQRTSTIPSTTARTVSFQVADSPTSHLSNVATRDISVVRGSALTIGDVRVEEGDAGTTAATFTIALSPPNTGPVTVQVRTQDGSATAGADYVALPPTTLTFAPGETTRTVAVAITGDTADESDEAFNVILSDATGATISRATATGYIVDDDTPNPRTRSQVVTAESTAVPGRLLVTVSAETSVCPSSNVIQWIDFGAARNARVEVPGAAPGTPGGPSQPPGAPNGTPGDFRLPVNAQSVSFFVQRQAPGDFKVDLAIVDTCNAAGAPFKTFVGGGVDVR